jgi:hypothetical protein
MPRVSPDTSEPPTAADPDALAPVEILTTEIELQGFIAPIGQRVTDMLLRGQDLAFLPKGAEAVPENWVSVPPSQILVVIPPPLAMRTPPPQRPQLRHLVVLVGPYVVNGTAHLPGGGSVAADLRLSHPFLPLTDASIAGGEEARTVPVAIVNLARSRDARFGE